jgi:hypothetical protein
MSKSTRTLFKIPLIPVDDYYPPNNDHQMDNNVDENLPSQYFNNNPENHSELNEGECVANTKSFFWNLKSIDRIPFFITMLFNLISLTIAYVSDGRIIQAFSYSRAFAFDSIFFAFHMISTPVLSYLSSFGESKIILILPVLLSLFESVANIMMFMEITVDFFYFSLMISQLFLLIFFCVRFDNEKEVETESQGLRQIIKGELFVFCSSSSMLSIGFRTMNFSLYFFSASRSFFMRNFALFLLF